MDYVVETIVYVVAGAAGLWIVIAAAGSLPLLMLAKVELTRLEDTAARPWLQKVLRRGIVEPQWLTDHAFEPRGVYRAAGQIGDPHFVVWRRSGERTYLCIYIVTGTRIETDLVTEFDQGGLTTGTTKDGLMVPGRPGHWMQAFSVRQAAELWKHHEAALDFLQQATGQRPSTQPIEFRDDFVASVRAQVAFLRTIPLWFLRMPYWYFVRRYRLHGKSVQQQYDNQSSMMLTAT